MAIPGRQFSAGNVYRYGFNGKEKDKDINSLTAYDYGFRIYNPAIGRFLSVDPLFKTYPYYTPYQFGSNNPIIAIDIDGLESSNDKNPSQDASTTPSKPAIIGDNPFEAHEYYHGVSTWTHYHGRFASFIFQNIGGNDLYIKHNIGGQLQNIDPGSFTQINLTKLQTLPSGLEHNEFANNTSQVFKVSDGTIGSDKAFVNWQLGNHVNGWGPETYEFSEKSKFSGIVRKTLIYESAVEAYIKNGCPDEFYYKSEYHANNQISNLITYLTPISIENFIGSADVFFKKTNDGQIISQVINVTSLTSGDFDKHIPGHGPWPKSTVKGSGSQYYPIPFSNVVQIFNMKSMSEKTIQSDLFNLKWGDMLRSMNQ